MCYLKKQEKETSAIVCYYGERKNRQCLQFYPSKYDGIIFVCFVEIIKLEKKRKLITTNNQTYHQNIDRNNLMILNLNPCWTLS